MPANLEITTRVVIIVTDHQLVPATRGHRVRIFGLIQTLVYIGFKVILVAPRQEIGADLLHPYVTQQFVVDAPGYFGGPLQGFDRTPYEETLKQAIALYPPEAVIAEYLWMAPCLSGVPRPILRVVDSHDLMHARTLRFEASGLDPWVKCTRAEEAEYLEHADVILAIQQEEAAAFRTLSKIAKVVYFPPLIHPFPSDQEHWSNTESIFAVGSDHSGNFGFARFVDEVWPEIRQKCPNAELRIAGSICRRVPVQDGCVLLGEVPDLAVEYRRAKIVVCPIEVGTGLKIKAMEALAYGKPAVGTASAWDGIPKKALPAYVEVLAFSDFARECCELLSNSSRRATLAIRARALAQENYSIGAAGAVLDKLLNQRL